MSEQAPRPERGKFNALRDQALYQQTLLGWHCEEAGRVSAPTGWFARISNPIPELSEVIQACEEDFNLIGFTDYTEIAGHFLLVETELGFVDVAPYETEQAAQDAFNALNSEYIRWTATLNRQGPAS